MNEPLFESKEPMNQDTLSQLQELCDSYLKTKFEIEKMEDYLKREKQILENLSRNLIPSLLGEYNLSEIRLSSGDKVIVQDKLKASIPQKTINYVYKNMVDSEGLDKTEALFKTSVEIDYRVKEVINLLVENAIPYEFKTSIHWQTLNKYCQEKLGQGEQIPDGISVFQYQETKIKR